MYQRSSETKTPRVCIGVMNLFSISRRWNSFILKSGIKSNITKKKLIIIIVGNTAIAWCSGDANGNPWTFETKSSKQVLTMTWHIKQKYSNVSVFVCYAFTPYLFNRSLWNFVHTFSGVHLNKDKRYLSYWKKNNLLPRDRKNSLIP